MSMTVGGKIGATSAVLVAFTVVLATASLLSIASLSERIRALQEDSIPGLHSVGRIDALARNVRVQMNSELLDLATNAGKGGAQAQAATAGAQAKLQEEMALREDHYSGGGPAGIRDHRPALDRCLQS